MKKLYSVFDKKAAVYCAPFLAHNMASAIRDLSRAANDPQSVVGQYPSDYELYEVGDWDENTGVIEARSVTFVVNAASLTEA